MELRAESLSLALSGQQLVDHVSLVLGPGELIGLIGPNGAGKSTLLNLLAGLRRPDDGVVYLRGQSLQSIDLAERSRLLAWVGQSGPINWPLTVERLISLGRRPHLGAWQRVDADDSAAIERAIAATDTEAVRQQIATTLSGGERTRVLLARALATEPSVLLADEPVATLDLGHQLQIMQVLRDFAQQQRSCLVVLHDLTLAARYCDRLYLMHHGKLHSAGTPADVLTDEHIRAVYGVDVLRGDGEVPWIVPVRKL